MIIERVFEDNIECTELLLHIIMNRDDIKVQEVHTQYSIKNLHGITNNRYMGGSSVVSYKKEEGV